MKFERINENQIRCTLNKADLADRDLLINELAYGTDKAKALFREMMQQASYEVGFEAENIPLMIEAIPVSPDCLVLIITKVEDPEELDTRFSKFTKPISIDLEDEPEDEPDLPDEDDDDVTTVYAHCKTIYVKEGDTISQGQQIGEVGQTGNATGPHLHFEIRKENRVVNPEYILSFE